MLSERKYLILFTKTFVLGRAGHANPGGYGPRYYTVFGFRFSVKRNKNIH